MVIPRLKRKTKIALRPFYRRGTNFKNRILSSVVTDDPPTDDPSEQEHDSDFDPNTATNKEKDEYYCNALGLNNIPKTITKVKKAYREMVEQYHPDKVGTRGEKIQRLAEEETKKINEAYEYFRRKLDF